MNSPEWVSILRIAEGLPLPPAAGERALGLQAGLRAGRPVAPAWVVPPSAAEPEIVEFARALEASGLRALAVRRSAASPARSHVTVLDVDPMGLPDAVKIMADRTAAVVVQELVA